MVHKDEASYIPPAKYAVLHAAVLEACDELDGVKDGVLENPTKCPFDPQKLLCKDADSRILPDGAAGGSRAADLRGAGELAREVAVSRASSAAAKPAGRRFPARKPMALADETYKFLVFKDANWNYLTFNAERDIAAGRPDGGRD